MLNRLYPDNDLAAQNGKVPGAQKQMIVLTREFLSYCQLRKSEATFKTYRSALWAFIDSLPAGIKPAEAKTVHVEQFLQRIAANYKISTANTYLNAVKSFFAWAKAYHGITNITKPVTKLREPKHSIRILSDEEYCAVLQAAQGTDHDAIQFLANTGLRRNEFKQLRWSDFDTDYVQIIGKGDKSRMVPLNGVCKKIIDTEHDGGLPPFVAPYQRHHAIYRMCEGVSKRANIKPFTPHSFRHYFATRLIKKGVPIVIVSRILGHADSQITERIYVHLVPADLRVTDILNF